MKLCTLIFLGFFTLAISAPATDGDVADARIYTDDTPIEDNDDPETASDDSYDAEDTQSDIALTYSKIGCYKDKGNFLWGKNRAISGAKVDYNFDPIHKCFNRAKALGFQYFAVQYGKECFTSKNAGSTYNKYGTATNCKNGKGGHWANSVYEVVRAHPVHYTTYTYSDASKAENSVPEDVDDASEDVADVPEDVADAPEDIADAPEYIADAPEDIADAPEDVADAPEDEADALEDVADAPGDEADAPEDVADALEDEADAPEDVADTPEYEADAPEDVADAP